MTTLATTHAMPMTNSRNADSTVDRAQRGVRAAQAQLVRQYQDDWYRFCRSLLLDAHAADDATQETALRVLAGLKNYAGQSTFRTWSFGIALNVCRELRRRDARIASGGDDQIAELPAIAADNPHDHATLYKTLAALSPRQREVIVLRYFEQLSIEQTASRMTCAQGTVKATISQALRNLRRMWKE